MVAVPSVILNNGARMPQLGFGVYQVPDADTAGVVARALATGYRNIDTAAMYGNEAGTGRALAESGVPREELFVTTKLNNPDHGFDATLRAFERSLGSLGLEYVDLYLIHWPLPARKTFVDTWRAFERLYAEGLAKSIGVSNFQVAHLRQLLDEAGVVPAVNQIELHPRLPQRAVRAFHAEHHITTEAWGPLGQGKGLLNEPVLAGLADKHRKTPAQVVLRWHLQIGNVVIPKSVTPTRIAENIDIFDFELDGDDLAAIDGLETGERLGPDPDTFNPAG